MPCAICGKTALYRFKEGDTELEVCKEHKHVVRRMNVYAGLRIVGQMAAKYKELRTFDTTKDKKRQSTRFDRTRRAQKNRVR